MEPVLLWTTIDLQHGLTIAVTRSPWLRPIYSVMRRLATCLLLSTCLTEAPIPKYEHLKWGFFFGDTKTTAGAARARAPGNLDSGKNSNRR